MNNHSPIEITVYVDRHSYKYEGQKERTWLQAVMPAIMNTQSMMIDEFRLGPLKQSISICLS